jgi:uncharacterized membrane protein YdjX (TVP38/TMEM64 family)
MKYGWAERFSSVLPMIGSKLPLPPLRKNVCTRLFYNTGFSTLPRPSPMRKADPSTAAESPSKRGGSVLHGIFFVLLLALGVAVYFTPLKNWLGQGQMLKAQLAGFGPAAPLVFTALAALLTAAGAPRLLLCSLAGLVFGFAEGLLWSQAATLLGSYGVFLFARRFGGRYELNNFRRLGRFSGMIENNGVLSVVLIRQLPMSGFYNNLFLGLTRVRHWQFLLGSLLGFLPLGVTACLVGAGLLQGNLFKTAEYVAVGLALAALSAYLFKWLRNLSPARAACLDAMLAEKEG